MTEKTVNINGYPRLLTQRQAAQESGYPEHFIRSLVAKGLIKSVPAGNRKYVLMQSLHDYINGEAE